MQQETASDMVERAREWLLEGNQQSLWPSIEKMLAAFAEYEVRRALEEAAETIDHIVFLKRRKDDWEAHGLKVQNGCSNAVRSLLPSPEGSQSEEDGRC